MNKKRSVSAFLGKLLHDNRFLAILSILLALFVWFYILYIVNPVNETVFDKVEVDLAYEGSVPDRNGYMYLMTDPNLTVSVTVSGSRSELLNLSKENIKATLNMDSVISEGTYNISVSASTGNSKLTVTDIYPKAFTIEFAAETSKQVPVELLPSGALPSGYEINDQSVSPQTITVTGPSKTVETVSKAYVTVPLTNVKEDISAAYDVSLVTETGENVDRRYLTLSDTSVQAAVDVCYRKTLQTVVELDNPFGSNKEDSFITVTLDNPYIKATGEEKTLSAVENLLIGQINTSEITKNTEITLPVPKIEGVTFSAEQVVASITFDKSTATKTLTFKASDITPVNTPEGKIATIGTNYVSIRIRGKAETLKDLTTTTLKCEVDLSENSADGSFPLRVIPTASVSNAGYDVVGSYYAKVNLQ